MSETTHPMVQHHILKNWNPQLHNMHKCIIIFHTVSKSNMYPYFMPTLITPENWIFWVIMQQVVAIPYLHFVTIYQSPNIGKHLPLLAA
jgi:hypothetical protein